MGSGRLTLPVQEGIDEAIIALIRRLGADAVRNSDGTELPAMVHDLATKVYGTYFVGRGDQAWALSHPEQSTHVYLMSARTPAHTSAPLTIIPADGYLADQVEPDTTDAQRWWQVNDRTTGQTLRPTDWQVTGQGAQAKVTIPQANPGHVYTVNFLARQIWDPTQMYNYLMNDWHTDPTRVRERPYD
ncbi:MAG: 1,3-beta-galactosyl-N-acetylhexosamine phosphorylase, partial [Propionibacteriaceae bacterium]|nr:1,3-beta-galactosyl-N-acetylhexosamine phosphorylase [Propionibacteriaceae bacterium]